MPPKPKPFALRIHRNQWRVRFRHSGTRYDKPLGLDKTAPQEQAQQTAAQFVTDFKAAVDRARDLRHSQNPITRYHRRLDNRSDTHAINCHAFHGRLIDFFGPARDLHTLASEDIEAWRDWLLTQTPRRDRRPGRGLAPKTVKEHLDWLAAVYNHAGLANPVKPVERPKPTQAQAVKKLKYFTPEQITMLFRTCRGFQACFLNALTFFVYTGTRVEEAQGIRVEHLNHATHTVPVTGKGDKTRPLNLTGPLAPAWHALLNQTQTKPRRDGYIFPQAPSWADNNIKRLCKNTFGHTIPRPPDTRPQLDLPGNAHMFRHTFASLALQYFEPRWDIAFLAKFLGHTDISTTYRIYGHWIAPQAPSGPTFASFGDHPGTTQKKDRP